MIVSSKLDRRITVERPVETTDRYGEAVTTWQEVATARAELVTASLTEQLGMAGEVANDALVFRIRHLADLKLIDRVLYAGRAYDITALQEIGRRQGFELRCEASE